MMRLAVLSSPESWYLNDLRRAAGTAHEITPISFSQLHAQIHGQAHQIFAGQSSLEDVDCVLVRTMPPGSLEQVVFRMDLLGQLEAAGTLVINPPRGIEAAVDKYLALAKLQAAGLRTPRTIVCQTADEALDAFESLGSDVVVKPLFGAEGRGITRINDPSLALRAFKMLAQLGAVIYLQQFIPHDGSDIRVLTIGHRVLAIRRRNDADWRTNVSRGATTEPFEPTDQMVELARRASDAIGAPLAGVDLLPGLDGRCYVLEVNAVPGWKALASTLKVDVAAGVLQWLQSRLRDSE